MEITAIFVPKLIARLWFCSRLLAKRPRGVTVPRHLTQNATMQPCPTKGGLQKQFRGADLAKFHGFFVRSDKLLLQNCAILHNAPQNGFVRLPNEKHTVQNSANTRKHSLGN
jgi:hypothetical protein